MEPLYYDLHIHSTASDGEYTPKELLEQLKQRGIRIAAITDHDTIYALPEARRLALSMGIVLINGIEFSVDGYDELHLLGYGIHETDESLCEYLHKLEASRTERAKRILIYLEKKGIQLDYETVRKNAKGSLLTRPHIAKAMVEAGYIQTISEAFAQYLAVEEFYRYDHRLRPSLPEAINLITNAGGIAVLAHPYSLQKTPEELDIFLKEAKGYGLQGMECYYSRYTLAQQKVLLELARKHKLIITGGSDYHGENVRPEVRLGVLLREENREE